MPHAPGSLPGREAGQTHRRTRTARVERGRRAPPAPAAPRAAPARRLRAIGWPTRPGTPGCGHGRWSSLSPRYRPWRSRAGADVRHRPEAAELVRALHRQLTTTQPTQAPGFGHVGGMGRACIRQYAPSRRGASHRPRPHGAHSATGHLRSPLLIEWLVTWCCSAAPWLHRVRDSGVVGTTYGQDDPCIGFGPVRRGVGPTGALGRGVENRGNG